MWKYALHLAIKSEQSVAKVHLSVCVYLSRRVVKAHIFLNRRTVGQRNSTHVCIFVFTWIYADALCISSPPELHVNILCVRVFVNLLYVTI